ncbi:MAG: hypothetical protein R3E39_28040 [Anaerolineae bacterium]
MKTIETDAVVTVDGHLTLDIPVNAAPGQYRVLVVLEEQSISKPECPPLDLPVDDLGPWPEGLTLSREEMYGDDGR